MASLGYTEPGRKPPSLNDLSLEQMLMSIRTPPAKGKTPYPIFQLASASLDQHIQWQAAESPKQKLPTENQLAVLQQKEEFDEISSMTTPLPDTVLRDSLERSEHETAAIAQEVESAFSHMASNPLKTMDARDREVLIPCEPPDIIKVPTAVQYLPALNPTEYAWLVGNTLAKTEITLQLARQEREGWKLLWVRSQQQLEQWEARITELENEREYIQRIRQMVLEVNDNTTKKCDQLDRIEADVKKAGENPLINRQLGRDRNRQRVAQSSPVSLPAPRERSSPAGTQYLACEIWLITIDLSNARLVPMLAATLCISMHPLLRTV